MITIVVYMVNIKVNIFSQFEGEPPYPLSILQLLEQVTKTARIKVTARPSKPPCFKHSPGLNLGLFCLQTLFLIW